MNLFGAIGNGIRHGLNDVQQALQTPARPQPVRTPAPMQQAPQMVRTPAPAQQALHPSLFNSIGNAISHIGAAPHPVQINTPDVVQKIQNARYGVLAHNPQARRQVLHNLNAEQQQAQPHVTQGISNLAGAMGDTAQHQVVQPFITRPAMELAQTVRQAVTHKSSQFTPGSPQMQAIFGNSPIQSIQANHATTQAHLQHSSNPIIRATAPVLATANSALHIANDIPVAGAALKGAVKGTAMAAPKAAAIAEKVAPKLAPAIAKVGEGAQAASQTLDKGAVATAKAVNKQVQGAAAKRATAANYDATLADLNKQKAALQQRIQNTNNFRGVETTQRHIDQLDSHIAQVQASKPQLTIKDRVLAPNIGLGTRSVRSSTGSLQATRDHYAAQIDGAKTEKQRNFLIDKVNNLEQQMKSTSGVPSTKQAPVSPHEAVPVPKQAATETGGVSSGNGSTKSRFANVTAKNSPEVSPEVKSQLNATYVKDTNKAATERSQEAIQAQGVDKATNDVLHTLNTSPSGSVSHDTMKQALDLANMHDASGDPARQAIAAQLINKVSEHGSAKGQGVQILATLAKKSPAGLRNKALTDIQNAGVKVTPEIQKEIQGHIDAISKMKDGPAKDMAIAVMQKAVSKHIPQSAGANALSVWKAGLLSGIKTQQGNALSNATFGIMKKASDPISVMADKAMALRTGQRSVALTNKGILSGTRQGAKSAVGTLKTGIDPRNIGDKYEQHAEINFKNKYIQNIFGKPSNLVFRGMSAADQPFYYSALKNSLYDQAKADGLTKGLTGKALNDHMTQLAANPTEQMAATAEHEADKAVLGYDTVGSRAVNALKQSIDRSNMSPAGKQATHAVINVLAPFTKVPSAFIARTIDFTPLGIPKTVISQVSHGKFDQRALSQAIGEGSTGTGIIALGVGLSQKGLVSGDYPKNDPKEAQRWKAEGITPNSVKIGGKWVSLNYLGPVGLLFNAGHQINQASQKGEGKLTQAFAAVGGLGQGLLGQSFLQGFSGFTNAIQDPQRSAGSYINSLASSTVPAIVNDIANVTDKFQRNANNPLDAIKNRIPGARETNQVKTDVYGNQLQQAGGQVGTLNGLKPSTSLTNRNPVIAEVSRLRGADPNNKDLAVTPTPIGKSITVDKQNIKLNDKQSYDLQNKVGQNIQAKWNDLIKTPEYQQATDTEKAAKLNNIKTLAQEDAQRQYVTANNIATYSKPESKKAVALAQGGDTAQLANSKGAGGTTMTINPKIDAHSQKVLKEYSSLGADKIKQKINNEPDYEYKVAVAKYANDKANGKLSTSQDIKARAAIDKANVGKDYSKNVRDLYGLSKAKLNSYLTTQENGVDKAKLADQLMNYDAALYDAGLSSSLKFKTGIAPTTKGSSGSVANGSGSRSTKAKSQAATSGVNSISSRLSAVSKAQVKYPNFGSMSRTTSSKFRVPSLKTKMATTHPTIKAYKVPKTASVSKPKLPSKRRVA